jgi:hypothetical protein
MNKKILPQNYITLQHTIDKVLGKIGLEQTITLLESFLGNTNIATNQTEKLKLTSGYVISWAIEIFDLQEEHFYSSNIREYREARMSCFYLLRKYTKCTYSKIRLIFNASERIVGYGNDKATEWLSVPKSNVKFVSHHGQLEAKLIEFIGKI